MGVVFFVAVVMAAIVIWLKPVRVCDDGASLVRPVCTVVNTADGILMIANTVQDPRTAAKTHVDVYLPADAMNCDEKYYAWYLLQHPVGHVSLHYTDKDLWTHK